ncbi:MAG: AbrB/MazE/SpoVT family DNA-binding domain-containing protein [Candidatus Woesearchaeota archaeon]
MIEEIKTTTITSKGQISIPVKLRKSKGFKEGDKLAIITYEDRIELRPLFQVNEKMQTAYASQELLAKDWESKEEDEAWKNL